MWCDLNYIWKEAFTLAWQAYKRNTIPIGAVIVDEEGNIISRGRNRIFDEISGNPLAGTCMGHAEMTAMINFVYKTCSEIGESKIEIIYKGYNQFKV